MRPASTRWMKPPWSAAFWPRLAPATATPKPTTGDHHELGRKGVTLILLWEKCCAQASDEHSAGGPVKPWCYSQLCENYRQTCADLLEIIDDRAGHRATIITSQLPIEHWHEWIGDQTIADAMLDRIMQRHHRFTLTGKSLRKKATPASAKGDNPAGTA